MTYNNDYMIALINVYVYVDIVLSLAASWHCSIKIDVFCFTSYDLLNGILSVICFIQYVQQHYKFNLKRQDCQSKASY